MSKNTVALSLILVLVSVIAFNLALVAAGSAGNTSRLLEPFDESLTPGAITTATATQPIPSNETWVFECIVCRKILGYVTSRNLQVDSAGHAHIVYGGDQLYYARYDGVAWAYEIVDSSHGVGMYASLALDVNGRPHISYHDIASQLKYAYWDGSIWNIQTVDSGASVGKYTSLALDAAGNPHISYSGVWASSLK